MFGTTKTLIVVYKDEMLMNQLKKLVETKDDISENQIVGTKDGSINMISWTEKVWLANKKAGNITGKVLFLGDIKGTDKLIPVVDLKFDDCGAKFGWAGKQAILFTDLKAVSTADTYRNFLKKLSALPVPDMVKKPQNLMNNRFEEAGSEVVADNRNDGDRKRVPAFWKRAQKAIENSAEAVGRAGAVVVDRTSDLFRDKNAVKRQVLFYGVVGMYKYGLEEFMNL